MRQMHGPASFTLLRHRILFAYLSGTTESATKPITGQPRPPQGDFGVDVRTGVAAELRGRVPEGLLLDGSTGESGAHLRMGFDPS